MREHWRKQLNQLHSWGGLSLGWLLYFVFVTGTLGYLDTEIDRWMQPELPPSQQTNVTQQLRWAEQYLLLRAPSAERWRIFTAVDRNQPWLKVQWRYLGQAKNHSQLLDSYTGKPLFARATAGGKGLYRLHYAFRYLPKVVAIWLVSLLAFALLLLVLSGILIHKHLLRDWFTFRRNKGIRSGMDLHLLAGTSILPFLLMISYSGLLFYLPHHFPDFAALQLGKSEQSLQRLLKQGSETDQQARSQPRLSLPAVVTAIDAPLLPQQIRRIDLYYPQTVLAQVLIHPLSKQFQRQERVLQVDAYDGRMLSEYRRHPPVRAVYESVLGLHEGTFASPALRLSYLGSGLLGTIAILSGLLLWEKKRARKNKGQWGQQLASRLNVSVIMGLPLAIAAYFIANRCLPPAMSERADWELDCMFLIWGGVLLLALGSNVRRFWVRLSTLTGIAFLSLPLLSLLFTEHNLLIGWLTQDWAFVGFELTALLFGCGFLLLSYQLYKRWFGT